MAQACVVCLEDHGRSAADSPDAAPARLFCIVAGFVLPHCPFVCPAKDWEYYIDQVTIPQVPEGRLESLHLTVQLWRKNRATQDLNRRAGRRRPGDGPHLRSRVFPCALCTLNARRMGTSLVLPRLWQSWAFSGCLPCTNFKIHSNNSLHLDST